MSYCIVGGDVIWSQRSIRTRKAEVRLPGVVPQQLSRIGHNIASSIEGSAGLVAGGTPSLISRKMSPKLLFFL
jgi:hypothetical protein